MTRDSDQQPEEEPSAEGDIDSIEDFERALQTRRGAKIARFVLGVLGGVPLAGGVFGATSGAWSEADQERAKKVFRTWLQLHDDEMQEIAQTLAEVLSRLDLAEESVSERVSSPEFLSLVKKCFRDWSAAESEEKRKLIRELLSNAASCSLCSDDVIRLFIEWIGKYSEAHFKVIREIYKHPHSTRAEIWDRLYGQPVREDSAEADLFKLIMHDLSVGHISRQHREVDAAGNYLKVQVRRRTRSNTLVSAFDDDKQYVLTELGVQFVHYTMKEVVRRIEGKASQVQ